MEDMTCKLGLERKQEVNKVVKEQEGISGRDLSLLKKSSYQMYGMKENYVTLKCMYLTCSIKTHICIHRKHIYICCTLVCFIQIHCNLYTQTQKFCSSEAIIDSGHMLSAHSISLLTVFYVNLMFFRPRR